MDRPIDETVKSLLKFVVRGFYGGSYVLVIDAILFHSVLAEEDLKQLLSINKTELGPLIARLRSDRLISIHKQREYPPNNKSVERIYFYIKYPHAIDAIKWKVHQLVQRFKDDLDKNSAPNGYMCPICLTKYSQLEAVQLLNYDRTEFLCSLCDEPLIEDDSGKKNKEKQDKLNNLMDQIQPLIDYLKKIDDSRIEENTFEFALAKLIPPQNQSHAAYTYNPKKGSTMFRPGDAPLANVMGTALGNDSSRRAGANSQATLHINITTANDEIAQRQLQERQAEEKRKQNAVPEWHKQSTIGKSALGRLDAEDEFDPQTTQNAALSMNENTNNNETNNGLQRMDGGYNGYNNSNRRGLTESEMEERENERTLNDYYAQLAKKQAREEKNKEEEEEEDFEDVDEFEMGDDDDDNDDQNKNEDQNNNDDDEEEDNGEFEDVVQDVPQPSKAEETNKESDDEDMDIDLEFEDV
ncbi:similar to Saccharomyces cerevisiae YKL028W TFA1 TFIIE large subunit, involved in recruitment of RNA polymerase II to the promoter, activation of TFIIH, and promoter opening [Maudiozyma saulgeensis]|uniref:Similar to Saccharomyces cerevisiae YKL028W TFA1 TFIIE large subunit, involved in recruitment of RNA polymerase II to the promoter, activation of TFIIH, and promoter opening n=1 Tax=Maudiozyma saulgeensis TaxID=1789683 RepID=A0A1X7QWN7_9SACH|nr:similar to Saccharomyces cerevisiae YKL028W TFA1 TFIIE large subunit, involved in recruitment of RNA polymerase II to the promoter, activation of TFIIH, and promoter opening [Kazachstania saulgeensis]